MVVDTQSKHCAASAGALLVRVWPIKCVSSPGALTGGMADGRDDGAAATSDEQRWLCPVRRLVAAQVPAEPVVAERQHGLVPPLRAVERDELLGTNLQDLKASVDQLSSVVYAADRNEPSAHPKLASYMLDATALRCVQAALVAPVLFSGIFGLFYWPLYMNVYVATPSGQQTVAGVTHRYTQEQPRRASAATCRSRPARRRGKDLCFDARR
jgi:hypothetical protein